MEFGTPVTELIRKRQSKRTYIPEKLPQDLINNILAILNDTSDAPFGNSIKFHLVEKDLAAANQKVKLGTYGFISGVRYFIAGEVKPESRFQEDFGYLLEEIILHLTELDLGTCWLGGTFSRKEFASVLDSKEHTVIPAITPVGFTKPVKSFREKLIRKGARSDTRKSFDELFFSHDFSKPLSQQEAGSYKLPLEMIRLAPSASNKQPWRIIKKDDSFHFYLKRSPGYIKMIKSVDLQRIDMGIAMSHFALSCAETKLAGNWELKNPQLVSPEVAEYTVSWKVS